MKKNMSKVEQSIFVLVGIVALGSFNIALGDVHTVKNNTQYNVNVTMRRVTSLCPDYSVSIVPGGVYHSAQTLCWIKGVEATILPNQKLTGSLFDVARVMGAINATPFKKVVNGDITWQIVPLNNQGQYNVIMDQ